MVFVVFISYLCVIRISYPFKISNRIVSIAYCVAANVRNAYHSIELVKDSRCITVAISGTEYIAVIVIVKAYNILGSAEGLYSSVEIVREINELSPCVDQYPSEIQLVILIADHSV